MLKHHPLNHATSVLSSAQNAFYAREGFLIIENFIESSICELLMQEALRLIETSLTEEHKTIFSSTNQQHTKSRYFLESGDKIRFFYEEKAFETNGELKTDKVHAINKIGHALHDLNPIFNCFSRMHSIAALAHDLEIVDPLLVQSMYIFKQPYIGGEVNCHQDSTYLFLPNQPVTGLWFALQDATLENGCLWALPGGHKEVLRSRLFREGARQWMEVYDERPWPLGELVPLPVSQGSLIVLHGLLPHQSKANFSPSSRHAYTLHLASELENYPYNNWLQRSAALPFRGFV